MLTVKNKIFSYAHEINITVHYPKMFELVIYFYQCLYKKMILHIYMYMFLFQNTRCTFVIVCNLCTCYDPASYSLDCTSEISACTCHHFFIDVLALCDFVMCVSDVQICMVCLHYRIPEQCYDNCGASPRVINGIVLQRVIHVIVLHTNAVVLVSCTTQLALQK